MTIGQNVTTLGSLQKGKQEEYANNFVVKKGLQAW